MKKETIYKLADWIKSNVKEANAKGVVFGLSGGVDSSVLAGISKIAFGEDALGIIMPIHSLEEDETDARLVSDYLNLKIEKVDLSKVYDEFLNSTFISQKQLPKANIKPRLRAATLYYYAQENNYLVLGATNKSEYHIGYFTKFGDSAVDLMPLADFTKDEIFEMARFLNLPEKIINKKPSAGLWEGQTDEEEMGFSYDDLDKKISGKNIEKVIYSKIEHLNKISEHKRNMPKIYKQTIGE